MLRAYREHTAKAEYATGMTNKVISAYGVAVADYLKGPDIVAVNVNNYTGQAGELIEVTAIDNFKVTQVLVEIRSATNALIESGAATPADENALLWRYKTTTANTNLKGVEVIVRAKDKPGNVTEMVRKFTSTGVVTLPPPDPNA